MDDAHWIADAFKKKDPNKSNARKKLSLYDDTIGGRRCGRKGGPQ